MGMANPVPLPAVGENVAALIPMSSPRMFISGPPLLPGLMSASVCSQSCELSGWLPASGDFDGDGQVDAGAYRKSTGAWRYRNVITGVQANLPTLGGTGFVPVVGLRP